MASGAVFLSTFPHPRCFDLNLNLKEVLMDLATKRSCFATPEGSQPPAFPLLSLGIMSFSHAGDDFCWLSLSLPHKVGPAE